MSDPRVLPINTAAASRADALWLLPIAKTPVAAGDRVPRPVPRGMVRQGCRSRERSFTRASAPGSGNLARAEEGLDPWRRLERRRQARIVPVEDRIDRLSLFRQQGAIFSRAGAAASSLWKLCLRHVAGGSLQRRNEYCSAGCASGSGREWAGRTREARGFSLAFSCICEIALR